MKNSAKTISYWLTLLTALGLIFIGGRFIISPAMAEAAFGINMPVNGDYSFHYIKGTRDIFAGLIIAILLLAKQYRALGIVLIAGTIIPVVDFSVVLSHPGYETNKLFPHILAIILCIVLGIYYVRSASNK